MCCDPSVVETDPNHVCNQKNLVCADASTPSPAFWDMACKADKEECPNSQRHVNIELESVDQEQKRKIKWYDPVPSPESLEWNCKYFVSTAVGKEAKPDNSDSGYIRLATITGGYNSTVWLIVQPYGQFTETTSSKVYNVTYGEVFYVPAEYQIYVTTSPDHVISDNGTSYTAEFYMQAKWVQEPDAELTKKSYVFTINRPDTPGGELTDNYSIKNALPV